MLTVAAALQLSACNDSVPTNEPEGNLANSADARVGSKLCLPQEAQLAMSAVATQPARSGAAVYLDGSQSMAGYATGSGDVRPLGDALAVVLQSYGKEADYHAFGRSIRPLESREAVEAFAGPNPYNCRGCDNQESRIDKVLSAIADEPPRKISLVVTDLWLDNRAFAGSPQVGLGLPLRRLLEAGNAIGIMGVRAPYKGPIYDLPGGGTYQGASERPLFLLMIGDEQEVIKLYEGLSKANSPSFSAGRSEFALFSNAPKSSQIPARVGPVGGGVRAGAALDPGVLSGLRQYRMDMGLARGQKGHLAAVENLSATLAPGYIWRGQISQSTRAWLMNDESAKPCSSTTWSAVGTVPNTWQFRDNLGAFRVGPEHATVLRPGNSYYIETSVVSRGVESPSRQAAWMRDWSVSSATLAEFVATKPQQFKALNLADLATVLEQELGSQRANGRPLVTFGFILKVER